MDDQLFFDAVEARREALIALTQDFIRFPTLNPPGAGYHDICEFTAEYLRARGYTVELIRAHGAPADSEAYPRWNMIARVEGSRPGECVHFNGHHDVVEVGQNWTRDPFGAELDNGRIYGRGTCDMKGGVATAIIAAEAFRAVNPDFAGAIEISFTADEETGGFAGAAYLAEKGYFNPDRIQHVIIPEPLNKDRICLGHRGLWWAEIETSGRIGHGSMPFLGDCAIRHMIAVMSEMEETLFPALASRRTTAPVVPDGARHPSINISSFHGGEAEHPADYDGFPAPIVPDRCRITIDRRYIIEETLEEVKSEMVALLEKVKARRPGFAYDIRDLFEVRPTMTSEDAPVVQSTSAAIGKVLSKHSEFVVSPGTYDQKHFDQIGGIKDCIAYGPGILDLAHQPDEWIGVDDMVDSAKVMALTLNTLLGDRA